MSKKLKQDISIGANLRRLTQDVLSGLAGLDRTHYSKLERGLRSPT